MVRTFPLEPWWSWSESWCQIRRALEQRFTDMSHLCLSTLRTGCFAKSGSADFPLPEGHRNYIDPESTIAQHVLLLWSSSMLNSLISCQLVWLSICLDVTSSCGFCFGCANYIQLHSGFGKPQDDINLSRCQDMWLKNSCVSTVLTLPTSLHLTSLPPIDLTMKSAETADMYHTTLKEKRRATVR
jgi:hypothetical protein